MLKTPIFDIISIFMLAPFAKHTLCILFGIFFQMLLFGQKNLTPTALGNLYSIKQPNAEYLSTMPRGEKRFALVIGITSNCAPCDEDAYDITQALQNLGFTCMLAVNSFTRENVYQIRDAAREYYMSNEFNIGLIYVSSHGMQDGVEQYFIPAGFNKLVNATPQEQSKHAESKAIKLSDLALAVNVDATRLAIAISDACREPAVKSGQQAQVVIEMNGRMNLFYPTPSGNLASMVSPNQRNSLFTYCLLEALKRNPYDLYQWKEYIEECGGGNGYQVIIPILKAKYSINNQKTDFVLFPKQSICGNPITDIDGNTYKTVQIGNQCWMAENLRTSSYSNGSVIPNVKENEKWATLNTGAWCNYDNNQFNDHTYGKLYNWYTVADQRNVCPTGWHIPSDDEWTILNNYLGGDDVAGVKMKSTYMWKNNGNGLNSSGFNGLPGGYCNNADGNFHDFGFSGKWWSSSEFLTTKAWFRNLNYNNGIAYRNYDSKPNGFSVRCLRD